MCNYSTGRLSWIIDNRVLTSYEVHVKDVHPVPLRIRPPIDGLSAAAVRGVVGNARTRSFNITITLTARNASILDGKTVHCSEESLISNRIHVRANRAVYRKLIFLM